jgi:hypothetical protein
MLLNGLEIDTISRVRHVGGGDKGSEMTVGRLKL